MGIYNFPESDGKTLYIDMEHRSALSFGELARMASDHFGETASLSQLRVDTKNIKVTGCSCHSEASDYNLYLVIEVDDQCNYTVDQPITKLINQDD